VLRISIVTVVFHCIRNNPYILKFLAQVNFIARGFQCPALLRGYGVLSCCIIKQTKNETIETKKAIESFYPTQNCLKFRQRVTVESRNHMSVLVQVSRVLALSCFPADLARFCGFLFPGPDGKAASWGQLVGRIQ